MITWPSPSPTTHSVVLAQERPKVPPGSEMPVQTPLPLAVGVVVQTIPAPAPMHNDALGQSSSRAKRLVPACFHDDAPRLGWRVKKVAGKPEAMHNDALAHVIPIRVPPPFLEICQATRPRAGRFAVI